MAAWKINGDRAEFQSGALALSFNSDEPSAGLQLKWNEIEIAKPLFSILLNDDPVETVSRLNDLIVRLPHRNSDLVSYELYFRANEAGGGVDMLLSAQTNLLDSKPEMKVETRLVPGSLLTSIAGIGQEVAGAIGFEAASSVDYFLLRPEAISDSSVVLMTHKTDFFESSADTDDAGASVNFSVFQDPLEKGVIRRARFRLKMVERKNDTALANEAYQAFSAEAPPLAT